MGVELNKYFYGLSTAATVVAFYLFQIFSFFFYKFGSFLDLFRKKFSLNCPFTCNSLLIKFEIFF